MSPDPTPKQKYKTCRRHNDPGHAHYLTFSCYKGRAFLSKDRTRHWLIQSILSARIRWKFDLWAFVIMPEHCHLLVFPREQQYSISRITTAIKLPVVRRAIAYLKREAPQRLIHMKDEQPSGNVSYRFWQRGGGYDRNLTEPRAIHEAIEYIHGNPVRRGLVERAEDWPWSSAVWFAGKKDVPLAPDGESIPTLHLD